jgi:type II secretory pathway component GspD/PulD (secretin)
VNRLVMKTLATLLVLFTLWCPGAAAGEANVSLSLRDTDLSEAMEMLSRSRRVNILLGQGVGGTVTLNLYDVSLDTAIRAIANASGYLVERRYDSYFIVDPSSAARNADGALASVRTFKVQYADPAEVAAILENHTSEFGTVTTLSARNMVVVQDRPDFLRRISRIVAALDREPRLVLIEAQILEIGLDDSHRYGIDWRHLFDSKDGTGEVGTQDLAAANVPGFFLEVMNSDFEVVVDALVEEGTARTLSTPKLLVLEDEEAEVIVGDRQGYRETTTINQVTTESVRFLESGIILRVLPSVDQRGRIRLDVTPEISTGTVVLGLPSQTTTSVTTQLLLTDGQTSFIGGLIKRSLTRSRSGVPVLRRIPGIGNLFKNDAKSYNVTETVVLITPHLVNAGETVDVPVEQRSYEQTLDAFDTESSRLDRTD